LGKRRFTFRENGIIMSPGLSRQDFETQPKNGSNESAMPSKCLSEGGSTT